MRIGKTHCYFVLFFILISIQALNQGIEQKFGQNSEDQKIYQKSMTTLAITQYTNQDPIAIFNDSAFGPTGYDFPGAGTPSDPYLIENYNITDSTIDLIWIENTTKSFRISNCFLDSSDSFFYGIYLVNVTQGMIETTIISNSGENGIGAYKSSEITISDCIIHDVGMGINFNNCSTSKISNNTIYNVPWVGIFMDYSNNNSLTNNTISDSSFDGIYLINSNNNTFTNNTIYNTSEEGIELQSSHYNNFSGSTIYNCAYGGIYLVNSHNTTLSLNTIHDCDWEGIYMDNSNNCTVVDNIIYDIYSEEGINLDTSHNNLFSGNTIDNCSFDNIYLSSSHNNTFLYNTIYNSPYRGIALFSSDNNTIYWNIVYNNTNYGLHISGASDDNSVKWNNFVHNNHIGGSQAFDSTTNNNIIYCNYWDDWTGLGNYSIDGAANNNDSSPLVSQVLPTVSIVTPLSLEYETDTIAVVLSGSPTIMHYWYYIDPLDSQNQTWTGREDRTLPDGLFTLHAYGNDTLGNIGYLAISFTIETSKTTTSTTTTSDDTTTTSKAGNFPGFIPILIFLTTLVMISQKRKKR
jgi:parallel beta-helix repeat protein